MFLSLDTFTWTRSVQHENTYVLLKLTARPISKYTKWSNKCSISLKFYHQYNRIRISGLILRYITKVFQNNFQLKKIVSLAIVLLSLQNSEWTRMIYFRGQKKNMNCQVEISSNDRQFLKCCNNNQKADVHIVVSILGFYGKKREQIYSAVATFLYNQS